MQRKIASAVACILAASALAGCAAKGVEAENATVSDIKNSVIVVMDQASEPEAGFDPAYGWGAGEHVHEPLIQSTLTVTTPDLLIGYDLATGMQVSDDGLLWTVTVRDDATFTDGEKLTAEDVAFTYNTVRDTSSVNDFTMLDYAAAVDDTTVEFHMTRPFSIWPYTMATIGIVPAHAYEPGYGQHPVGSGRYMLRQWDKGQQVILEANPDYYGEAPSMQRVTIVFMEEATAYAAAAAGQADVAYTSATYSGNPVAGYSLLAARSVDNRGINLPAVPYDGSVGNDVTSDVAVRQTINIGIDRQTLVDGVLDGYGSPAYSVCDGMPWCSDGNIVQHDPDAAAALLDEAEWVPGADGIRAKDGVRAELALLYPVGDSIRQALASATANQLHALGFAVTVEGVGWDTAYDRAQTDALTWGWGAHTPMELYNIYHTKQDTGLAGYSPYASETVDAYMDGALAAGDTEQSYALWQQAQWDGQGGIAADVPWVWLVNIDHLYWVRDGLQVAGQKVHPHGHGWSIVNNVDQWVWS